MNRRSLSAHSGPTRKLVTLTEVSTLLQVRRRKKPAPVHVAPFFLFGLTRIWVI